MSHTHRKLLPPSEAFSVFKLRVVFNDYSTDARYTDHNGEPRLRQKTIYSWDFEDERQEATRSKPIEQYNGYKYLRDFALRVYRNKQLYKAQLYANQLPDRPLIDEWKPE